MTCYGYTPYPHQRAVHDLMKDALGSGNIYVVKSRRQTGKTTMAENILLKVAFEKKGSLSVLVEPTLDQSRRVYKEMVKAMEGTPVLVRKNDSLLEIEVIGGSTILFKSAEQRDSLRGFTVTGILVIDECAFIPDEIYDILQPTTDVHRAPILLISTPKLRQGFFWRYWSAGLAGTHPHIKSVDFNDFDLSFILPVERLEQYRAMMPRAQFTSEYLGEFLESDAVLFTGINECVGGYDDVGPLLFAGIDWGSGSGGDYTAVAVFNVSRQMVDLSYFNDKGTTAQVAAVADTLCNRGIRLQRINAEANSIGAPLNDLLRAELNRRHRSDALAAFNPFTTTNEAKVRLVSRLQVALEQKTVRLLPDKRLTSELAAYEAAYNPRTGSVSYNAPAGLHDDTVMATMLALDAVDTGAAARYTISFKR